MNTLLFERNVARFAAARLVSALGSGRGAGVGPLRLVEAEAPELPGPDWYRVRPRLAGICGSDLATLDGRSSRYFEELVSFPFVPGHEVVGTVTDDAVGADGRPIEAGRRVVLEPVLGCVARGIDPPCPACAAGDTGDCERVMHGHLRPGLQTGFCADTGGGWSSAGLVAHASQLHAVPDDLSDADAVMVEPLACAVHAALSAGITEGDTVAVVGAGTVGLALVAAVAQLGAAGRMARPAFLAVGARHPHQRRWASELGADATVGDDQLARLVRRQTRTLAVGGPSTLDRRLAGGADVVVDCVGSADSVAQSLALVRPRGRVLLVGMPGRLHVDLAPLWHREVALVGAYAYGTERVPAPTGHERRRSFDLAMDVARATRIGRLVSATYPVERFEEALAHAGAAGRRGAVKIAFDLDARAPRPEPEDQPAARRPAPRRKGRRP